MTVLDILRHFYERCAWVRAGETVDRVIYGNPALEVKSAVVTWISSVAAIRAAAENNVDLLITHEPTFWDHWDDTSKAGDAQAAEKQRLLDDTGICVARLHDSWDLFPEIGIPFAWAQFLGFGNVPVAIDPTRSQHRYDITPITAGELALRIARRTAQFGEPLVQFSGDPDQRVSRIGIGTGCGCNPAVYRELGCDLSIVCDDGTSYWQHIQRSIDNGMPVIRVNHGTSEEPGMLTLMAYLQQQFPLIDFDYLPHRCTYTLVGEGTGTRETGFVVSV